MREAETDVWELIERDLGKRPVRRRRPDCGLSAAVRYAVEFDDGTLAFVKAAVDDETEAWLRNEHAALEAAAPFMPQVLAWLEAPGERPVLLTRDLSGAYWPASHAGVAWRPGDMETVIAGIAEIGRVEAPDQLPALANGAPVWPTLAHASRQLEREGLCSGDWIERVASDLAEAEAAVDVEGRQLVHGDLRSDNVCIEDGRAVFVDWSHAARGNGEQNLASILASLHLEGGPPPFDVLPGGGGWAARDAAMLASRLLDDRAQMPPWLRAVIRRLAVINLDWAAASLGLPERDPGGRAA